MSLERKRASSFFFLVNGIQGVLASAKKVSVPSSSRVTPTFFRNSLIVASIFFFLYFFTRSNRRIADSMIDRLFKIAINVSAPVDAPPNPSA